MSAGKTFKRIFLGVMILLLLLAAGGYFIFRYKLKDLVEEIVLIESGYTYELKMSKFSFSYRNRFIRLEDARLTCLEPGKESGHYGAAIPELYLSIDSWRLLLRSKKLDIDSLYLRSPDFHIYRDKSILPEDRSDKPVADVLDILNDVRIKLGIRSMNIENASIAFHSVKENTDPFVTRAINFKVCNFSDKKDLSTHFLSAEDISLDVGRQNWIFPNGSRLAFSRMYFSGKSQFFELDSCQYSSAEGPNKGRLSFSADEARWSSHHLPDIYTNGEVTIDTIYLATPVINFMVPEKDELATDSSSEFSANMSRLFGEISIQYIQVDDGKLLLESAGEKKSSYSSRSTDLVIRDLDINRDSLPHVRVGSIDLKLNEVILSTADSQYVLSIDEFGLADNNLICKNAVFSPTSLNNISNDFTLSLPEFILNDISLPDILQKKFKASSGTFLEPDILLRIKDRPKTEKKVKGERLERLYHSLNGLAQLINVKDLAIRDANMEIIPGSEGKGASVLVSDLNAEIKLNRFLESNALVNMKEAIPDLNIKEIKFKTFGVNTTVRDLELEGDKQKNYVRSLSLLTRGGVRLLGQDLFWQNFDWDRAMNLSIMELDSVDAKSLLLEIDPSVSSADSFRQKDDTRLSLFVRKLNADEIFFFMRSKNGGIARSKIASIRFDSLTADHTDVRWKELEAHFINPEFRKDDLTLSANSIDLKSNEKILFRRLLYKKAGYSANAASLEIKTRIRSIAENDYLIDELNIDSPDIRILKDLNKVTAAAQENNSPFEKKIRIQRINAGDGKLDYSFSQDSLHIAANFSLQGSSLLFNQDGSGSLEYDKLGIDLARVGAVSPKWVADIPILRSVLLKGMIDSAGKKLKSGIDLDWENVTFAPAPSAQSKLLITDLSGSFSKDDFMAASGIRPDLPSLIRFLYLQKGRAELVNEQFSLKIDSLRWKGTKNELITGSLNYSPRISRDSFFAASSWQKDYLTLQADGLRLVDMDAEKLLRDSSLKAREIHFLSPVISASRNKNIPFEHGREKPMPTKLISSIGMPLQLDSVFITKGTVYVNEVSNITGREGNVIITDLNAGIYDISNQYGASDSLRINANARIFDHHIRSFKYRESYNDSLSGFRMSMRMAPMDLTRLSSVTNPLAAVNVERGRSDTLVARISGNKYASYGEMDFQFRDLKIRMLNKQDTSKKNFLLSFENLIANSLVLRSKNNKKSTIFFRRDREKFIFNYWIKSVFSGVMTGAGVKSNRKFEKEYKAVKETYSLPGKKE